MQLTKKTPSGDNGHLEWQALYQQALLELDMKKLRQLVVAAETAIYDRLRDIGGDSNHQAERQAIADAISSLRVLKRNCQ